MVAVPAMFRQMEGQKIHAVDERERERGRAEEKKEVRRVRCVR